jgi:hypothetical protein
MIGNQKRASLQLIRSADVNERQTAEALNGRIGQADFGLIGITSYVGILPMLEGARQTLAYGWNA